MVEGKNESWYTFILMSTWIGDPEFGFCSILGHGSQIQGCSESYIS